MEQELQKLTSQCADILANQARLMERMGTILTKQDSILDAIEDASRKDLERSEHLRQHSLGTITQKITNVNRFITMRQDQMRLLDILLKGARKWTGL